MRPRLIMSLKKNIGTPIATDRTGIETRLLSVWTCEFYPKFGGIATYCHELANAAGAIGFEVSLFAPSDARYPLDESRHYQLRHGPWAANHNPPAIWNLRKTLKSELSRKTGYHLIAEPGPILALGALSLREDSGNTIILIFHGSEILRWSKSPPARILAERAMRAADKIICVARPIADLARSTYPEFGQKITAVPNALPRSYMDRASRSSTIAKKDQYFNILSVGRFHPRKGFDHLIQAIGRLPDSQKSKVSYTIAGGLKSPKYLAHLRKEAQNCGVQLDCLTDIPAEELCAAYERADAFALTSFPHRSSVEGFGLVYLEAGAYGLPCLAYDTGGVSDAVRHRETGFLCKQGDIADLSKKLSLWIDSPERLRRMGESNRRFATTRTWSDVLGEILAA
jgi:glycosyltransferase involved in cell wall biosynthesis